ncbi:phytanoyl-CoA dioxygenase family protein [Paenibacillus sp. UNC499MF]|uniref:phytanoyl-CoA dioxygenase family protein n=1 Tax=Paenibacillus sp. UNC499MF TaxID=1502751 RepID=UPI00089FA4FC|nr:phytanoyl-CoA dioxygenase family protein [Paenibacillus sp. UNC499MF]SEF86621.1 Phytanoyl-CoA dioxygenase (PhyH) [Paenibacillus sp. UNC499MF]
MEHSLYTADLHEETALSPGQLEEYRSMGHVYAGRVAADEDVAVLRSLVRELVRTCVKEERPLEERDDFGRAFLQLINLWQRDEAVKKFVFARKFARMAADLMETDGVRLYLDQIFYKEPGGGPTPWHQDGAYMLRFKPDKLITLWMPLTDIPDEMGSLRFISGAHEIERMKNSGNILLDAVRRGLPETGYKGMKAGHATFHSGWTPHSALANPTDSMREVLTITYIAEDAVIADPEDNEARRKHLETYFPGRKPGERADSPLNPVLYRRGEDARPRSGFPAQ